MFNIKLVNGEEYLLRLASLETKVRSSKFWLPLSLFLIAIGFSIFFFMVIPLASALIIGLIDTACGFLPFYILGAMQTLGLYVIPFFITIVFMFYIKITDNNNVLNTTFSPNYSIIIPAIIIAFIAFFIGSDFFAGIHTILIQK